jgi:hypothetical protein
MVPGEERGLGSGLEAAMVVEAIVGSVIIPVSDLVDWFVNYSDIEPWANSL